MRCDIVLQRFIARGQRLNCNHPAWGPHAFAGPQSENANVCADVQDCVSLFEADAVLDVALLLKYLTIKERDVRLADMLNPEPVWELGRAADYLRAQVCSAFPACSVKAALANCKN